MATPTTRVRRGGDPAHNPDVAMVGSAADQAASITIDPSELEANPLLGGDEEDEGWDLPEGQRERPQQREPMQQREPATEGDEPEEDVRLAYDEDAEDENIRSGRRARRNRSRRGAIDQRDQIIEQMAGELAQQRQLLHGLYGGQVNLSTRDVDQRISFHNAALERADIELARAVKEADGDAFALITKERDKVYRELFQLQQLKQGLEERAREMQQGGSVDQQPQRQQQDPRVQQAVAEQNDEFERMRDVFLDRYPWFDPDRGRDEDHRLVKRIDAEVTEDGYQRHTKAFWHEMERRMQREGFRAEAQAGGRREEQEDDVQPTRRTNGHANGGGVQTRRSTPPTGAGGRSVRRPGNGNGAFGLSEMQMDLLRDEDLVRDDLSEDEVAKRDRIINKWKRGANTLRGR